jgi:DNA polymerase-3 subunit gamma/tau
MSLPLTAKYRPQRFSDVAGQDTLRDILSRACAEDKIAPAYLFSGTRGVGKTTVARIMAKAINCANAPTAEPCNQCSHCLQITQGAAVDVIEIDGASNRGIEDARRIKEDVGYAPMDCRYKVFIIDEAHMLTKEAFNALLKTLEEPPRHVAFIMATTEPHKFPATIVSRCQHYTFKRLSHKGVEEHLASILQRESMDYEPAALRLLARRASGSVRDSMSLLGQVLALGREKLLVEDVRGILGLAGSDIFFRMLETVRDQDAVGLLGVLSDVLDQGLDLGFFLRELTMVWRNLFLLKQVGERAFPILDLAEEEARQWLEWTQAFTPTHIHACWQLTLEGQRRVLTSVDPALALELLLLNLAYLPELVNLEQLALQGACAGAEAPAAQPAQARPSFSRPAQSRAEQYGGPPPSVQQDVRPNAQQGYQPTPHPQPRPEARARQNDMAPPPDAPPASSPVGQRGAGVADPAGFTPFCLSAARRDGKQPNLLKQCRFQFSDGRLLAFCSLGFIYDSMVEPNFNRWLSGVVGEYFGEGVEFEVVRPKQTPAFNDKTHLQNAEANPTIRRLQDEFDARIIPGSFKGTK